MRKAKEMINCGLLQLKQRVYGVLTAKRAGMEGLVTAVILCVIALVLAFIFRDAITEWFNNLIATFKTKSAGLF